jgi:hypothetical protein
VLNEVCLKKLLSKETPSSFSTVQSSLSANLPDLHVFSFKAHYDLLKDRSFLTLILSQRFTERIVIFTYISAIRQNAEVLLSKPKDM